MTERVPTDHLARAQAIEPTGSYIVQAPAGSGKTSLLTDRIIALLARVERPEQIVAMTFTRKAASEMHSRVMDKLQMAQSAPQPEAGNERLGWELAREALQQDARKGWGLLAQPSRLRIMTIDAFCSSLVKSMPWFSSLGGMPRISDDPRRLYQLAAGRVLALAGSDSAVDLLLRHLDLDLQAASDAIADMLGQRDQWLHLLAHAEHEDAEELLEQALRQTIALDLTSVAQSMPQGWQQDLAPAARLAAAALQEAGVKSAISTLIDWQEGELGADPDQLPHWQGLAELLLTAKGEPRTRLDKRQGCTPNSPQKQTLTAWLECWQPGNNVDGWCDLLHQLREVPQARLTESQAQILRAQADVLKLAVAHLHLVFAARAEVDFIEVAQRATEALGRADDPSDLLLRLDQQIQHLLVDEFQDTSKAQLELLETLTSGWQPGDGRTLFLVGDPMQSIYRFRKAEVGLFLKVRDSGLGAVELQALTLTENFRSNGAVVSWVNDVFSRVLPARDSDEMGAIRYSPSIAWHKHDPDPAVHWHLLPDRPRMERQVVQLATHAWQQSLSSDKPVAILVRSRTHLGEVTLALRQAGVPVRAVDLEGLGERPVVIDLLALARAISHLGDRAAWIAALRARWCGLTLASLHELLWNRPRDTVADVLCDWLASEAAQVRLVPDQRQRLLAVAPRLLDAVHDDGSLPFAARIQALWQSLDGPHLVDQVSDLDDAQALFELMDQLAEHSYLDIDLLQDQLGKLYARPATASDRAIEVMTMHKAKGLEFDTVILMGLERLPPSDRAPLVRIEQVGSRVLFGPVKASAQKEQDPVSMYLGQREQKRQTYETDRLLYVAATRARQQLHLVAQVSVDAANGTIKDPGQRSLLSRLWQFCPAQAHQLLLDQHLDDASSGQDESGPQWMGPAMLRRAEPLPVVLTSERSAQTASDVRPATGWASEESTERLVGTLLHAWFAHFVSSGSRDLPDADRIKRQLARIGMPGVLRDQAAGQVQLGLQALLASERGSWLLSQPQARVEWSLVDTDEVVSVLDLAIDQESHWLVVDYKTSRRRADETVVQFSQRMIGRYQSQMQRYVTQLQALDGRPAKAALYFPLEDLWLDLPD